MSGKSLLSPPHPKIPSAAPAVKWIEGIEDDYFGCLMMSWDLGPDGGFLALRTQEICVDEFSSNADKKDETRVTLVDYFGVRKFRCRQKKSNDVTQVSHSFLWALEDNSSTQISCIRKAKNQAPAVSLGV